MNLLNMLILHFANFVLKPEHHVKVLPIVQVPLFYPGEGPFPACHKGNDQGWEWKVQCVLAKVDLRKSG